MYILTSVLFVLLLVGSVQSQQTPPAIFTSSAGANPVQVPPNAGAATTIAATFTSSGTVADVNLDIEVRDSAENKVFQQLFTGQSFFDGQSQSFTATWIVPSTLAEGSYTVKTGAFSSDWATGYGWNDNAASISVGSGTPPAFYVDCTSGDDNNGGLAVTQPWATLERANAARLLPGSRLLLKRDCGWTGTLAAAWTGTASQPITIGTYGEGALPRISGTKTILVNVTGSYQIIDGLALSATADRVDPGCRNQTVGSRTGVYFQASAHHNTFQNSDLTSLSVGVDLGLGSTYNSVTHNLFHDVNMMFTLTPQSVDNNDDAGGQNVLIEGDYNDIGYNTFTGAITCQYDYSGVTGQPFVLYGGQHNSIHHNRATGSGANFVEAGANVGAGRRPADDNTFAYNVSVGSQFFTAHGHGDPWGPALHSKLLNNVSYTTGGGSISCEGCGTDILQMRNNIIWADTSATLYVDGPLDEAHNIFWNRGGNPYNSVPISPTSRIADPQFVNPDAGDFHVRPTSPALSSGTTDALTAGYTVDVDGNPLQGGAPPAIGVYAR